MVFVVAEGDVLGVFPGAGGVDDDDRFSRGVIDTDVVGYDSVRRLAPAVNRLAVALDDVADDFVVVEQEVRLQGGLAADDVVVVTADVAQPAAMRGVPQQDRRTVRVERARVLDGDVFGVERLAGAGGAPLQELAGVFAVEHDGAHRIDHGDALDMHATHAAVDEHTGVDVLDHPARDDVAGPVHVDRPVAEDADVFDVLGLCAVTDPNPVRLRPVVRKKPETAGVVPRRLGEADLHSVVERLPVACDAHLLAARGGPDISGRPFEGVGPAVLSFAVDPHAKDDGAGCEIKLAADFEIVEPFGRSMVDRDLRLRLQHCFVVGQFEDGPGLQLDRDRFVDVEQRPMPAERMLMQAGGEGEFVAGSGVVKDVLRVVIGVDDVLFGTGRGGGEVREGQQDEESRSDSEQHWSPLHGTCVHVEG